MGVCCVYFSNYTWKTVTLLWELLAWQLLKRLTWSYHRTQHIPLLGVYPKEWKTMSPPQPCTWMFIAALFISAKKMEAPQVPIS